MIQRKESDLENVRSPDIQPNIICDDPSTRRNAIYIDEALAKISMGCFWKSYALCVECCLTKKCCFLIRIREIQLLSRLT